MVIVVMIVIIVIFGCQSFASFNAQCKPNDENNISDDKNQECNPWKVDFTKGENDMFTYIGPYQFNGKGMLLQVIKGNTPHPDTGIIMGNGTLVTGKNIIRHGKISVRISSARIGGIVTSFALASDDKDEIDWEWVGKNEYQVQSNYYSKGGLDYTKGGFHGTPFNTHNEVHNYSINWNSEKIQWAVDNVIVRTVLRSETKSGDNFRFPTSPMIVRLSLWDGGASLKGTRDWAGGKVDWNDQEFIKNGGYIGSLVKSITYEC